MLAGWMVAGWKVLLKEVAGWPAGWLAVGWLGWLAAWLADWLVGTLANGCQIAWLDGCFGWLAW